jgi:uncharacterized protein
VIHREVTAPRPMRSWHTHVRIVMGVIAGVWIGCATGACDHAPSTPEAAAAAPAKTVLRHTAAATGARFARQLATIYGRALPTIEVQVVNGSGGTYNLDELQAGQADLAFSFADVAYMAFAGHLEPGVPPFDRLRAISVLPPTPIQLFVRRDAPITGVQDLRGRRVNLGGMVSVSATLVLDTFGMRPDDVEAVPAPNFDAALQQLTEGTIDAIFIPAAYPNDGATLAAGRGARLVPIEGPSIERVRREYPFLRLDRIPAGTYVNQPQSVHTIAVDTLYLCRSDLAEDTVYQLTKAFFEGLPSVAAGWEALRLMDLDRAPATNIPLHPGAARYYRQREFAR